MVEGAIFDMDGVLLDNARYHIRAWQKLGKELGEQFTPEAIRSVFGRRNREILPAIMKNPPSESEAIKLTERKEAHYRELIRGEIRPVPGLMKFLGNLKEQGVPAAVGTSAPIENVEMTLEALGLKSYFAAVVIGAEVARSKPAPDIFLAAAKRMSLPPERCVVFEDSASGLQAANAAGCPCVALSTTHTAEELCAYPAIAIIPDFTKVSIADCELRVFD
jgi:beta-phosphoglucomutase family hydrolase